MAEVSMPFTGKIAYQVLTGAKTCTTRLERKGCKGDTFQVTYAPMNITKTYKITRVLVTALADVSRNHYRAEGFFSMEDFLAYWSTLYPDHRSPFLRVYAHFFKEVL